jgi:hypothetical protein
MQGRNDEVFCVLGMYASTASKRTNRRKARAREIHVKMYVSKLTMYMILKAAGTLLTKNIGEQWPFRAVADSCLPATLQRRGLICF